MLKIIEEKYTNDKQVKMSIPTDACHLIISEDEIIYLKSEGRILIDKYSNSSNKPEIELLDNEEDYRYTTQLFEYNKNYLDFTASIVTYNLNQFHMFKGSNKSLCYSNPISMNFKDEKIETLILNRQEVEDFFNKDKFDSMYVLDKYGIVLFAKDEKNGILIDRNIVPTDKEIIEMDYKHRKSPSYFVVSMFEPPQKIKRKSIDEIQNIKIYTPFLGMYSHMLLTIKDNKINIIWFRLDFLKKDEFKLNICEIPFKKITVDDVVNAYRQEDLRKLQKYEDRIKVLEEQINSKEESSKKLLLKRKNI